MFMTRSVDASLDKIKYQLKKNDEVIAMSLLSDTVIGEEKVLDTGKIGAGNTNDYELRLWIDESVSSEEAIEMTFNGSLRIVGEEKKPLANNRNIVAIYQYDASSCITGEEETCTKTTAAPTIYKVGTIVKYKVNDTEEKYFHIISDNGSTLTMQQRENTIYATPWYETSADNTKGPLTVLLALENATASWTNVNDQTYTMGVTTFKDNVFTGCAYDSTTKEITCRVNTYTLGSRTGKARMITAQEAGSLGCRYSVNQSCPNWMNNYLNDSTINGGTVNQSGGRYGNNFGYWTMSATSSYGTSAMHVNFRGNVTGDNYVSHNYYGARAVVVIDK